jgi:hypothetical protein
MKNTFVRIDIKKYIEDFFWKLKIIVKYQECNAFRAIPEYKYKFRYCTGRVLDIEDHMFVDHIWSRANHYHNDNDRLHKVHVVHNPDYIWLMKINDKIIQ